MLVIAVGFGVTTDPFTTSTDALTLTDDPSKVDDMLEVIRREKFKDDTLEQVRTWVDEILVIDQDEVLHHFSWEDGLGEQLPEVELTVDASTYPDSSLDLQEAEDESDSEDA